MPMECPHNYVCVCVCVCVCVRARLYTRAGVSKFFFSAEPIK